MLHNRQYTPPAIRSLLSHLEAALGACGALLDSRANADPHNVLRFELTAIAHVLQAREDMKELRFADGAVASQVSLFLTVTGCLEDAAPVEPAAAGLEAAATRLIGGRIPVETLMALAAAMRDVVELCFATFDGEAEAEHHAALPAVSEAMIWATSSD